MLSEHLGCWARHAPLTLVEIQNEKENKFVAGMHRDRDIWIGLSDRKKEGQWIWETSRKVASYTKWNPGEPNDKSGRSTQSDCALIWRYKHLETWDDRNCDAKKYFVCEREEYKLIKLKKTGGDTPVASCRKSCSKAGLSLMPVSSSIEYLAVKKLSNYNRTQSIITDGQEVFLHDLKPSTFLSTPNGARVTFFRLGLRGDHYGSNLPGVYCVTLIGDSHDGQIDVCRLVAMVI